MLRDVSERQKDINSLVEAVFRDKEKFKELFVVAFDHNDEVITYIQGNWHSLAKASAFLNLHFIDQSQKG